MRKYPFFFFQKNADVSIFVDIQGSLSRKYGWIPLLFFVDSNSPCKDLLFPHGPNLAQKPLYLVGTVLKAIALSLWRARLVSYLDFLESSLLLVRLARLATLFSKFIRFSWGVPFFKNAVDLRLTTKMWQRKSLVLVIRRHQGTNFLRYLI